MRPAPGGPLARHSATAKKKEPLGFGAAEKRLIFSPSKLGLPKTPPMPRPAEPSLSCRERQILDAV